MKICTKFRNWLKLSDSNNFIIEMHCRHCTYICSTNVKVIFIPVEGGHRAIIFNRIGGVQNDIYTEGLHFRIPWFQYPIIYDIR